MWYPNLPWDNSFLICKNRGVRHATSSSQTQRYNRNKQKRATLFGAGYTKYQPEMVFLDLFVAKTCFCAETRVNLQNTKELLN